MKGSTYQEIRPRILTGDAILWKGSGLISKMILKFSGYSHASLVVRFCIEGSLRERVFLVEALSNGLQFRLLSERLKGYKGRAFWMHVDMTKGQMERSREHALIECAKNVGYDYSSLFKNILGRVSADSRNYFCSEFVWVNWIYAGFIHDVLSFMKAPRPGDLTKRVPCRVEEINV